jgi:WD repeat-containing protein 48
VPEVNTRETVAHWCQVDTRTGSLTCTLEENYCFDAEMYADEIEIEEQIEFREDQRSTDLLCPSKFTMGPKDYADIEQ